MTHKYADATDKSPFSGWFEEVVSASLTVDKKRKGLSHEAGENWWSFSISQHQADTITTNAVVEFLLGVALAREQQIKACPGPINPMQFYCWCDEQDSTLDFSLVSACHYRLPFGAIVKETDDFAPIVQKFLSNEYHNGIPIEEFMMEEISDGMEYPEPPPYILLVATKILPTS